MIYHSPDPLWDRRARREMRRRIAFAITGSLACAALIAVLAIGLGAAA